MTAYNLSLPLLLLWSTILLETKNADCLQSLPTPATLAAISSSSLASATKIDASTVSETKAMIRGMRDQLNENEDARIIMDALRGRNLNDDDSALDGLQMRLVDVEVDPKSGLPYEYDPVALKIFFAKRPFIILTRILQLASVGGGLVFKLALDKLLERMKDNPELEIKRVEELRDTITSLGPFYIKIGQALSVRPDVLSPRSMVELQKLCDKVPSYSSVLAFSIIEKELGKSATELFSEITPEPVAAASLGQVYKAKLRSNGKTVAVKVRNLFFLRDLLTATR